MLELAENAYPKAVFDFKMEIARDNFLQGVSVSDETREKMFISQSKTLSEAVRLVRQIESAQKASQSCKSPQPSSKTKAQCQAVNSASDDKISKELKEMKELVVQMNERVKQLEGQQNNRRGRQGTLVCYNCNEQGHFARSCPNKRNAGNEHRGLGRSTQPSHQP